MEEGTNQIIKNNQATPCDNINLLRHIKNTTYSKKNYQIIEELSSKYIQQKINQFLFELDIGNQLDKIYKYLDFCSQLPQNQSNFKYVFKIYLQTLREIYQVEQKKFQHGIIPQMHLFIIFGEAIQEQSESINNIIKDNSIVNNCSVQDFCKSVEIEIQSVSFKFQFNFQKFQEITELLKKISISQNLYWQQFTILSIFDLINFVLSYYDKDEDKDFDFDLLLKKFQPLENIQNEKAVFMVGLTKVGKSTLTSLLQDPENIERKVINGENHYDKINQKEIFSINTQAYSNISRKVEILSLEGFDFLDNPGLNDTNEQFRIINSKNISKYLNQYKQIVLVIVIQSLCEQIFVQNFKSTFNYLRVFGQQNFQNEGFKPLFILTFIEPNAQGGYWIDNFCNSMREEITNYNDNQDFLREFAIFFQAYDDQRIILFPSPKYDLKLSDLKDRIVAAVNLIQQSFNNYSFQLNQSEIHKKQLERFQIILFDRVKNTIDFIFMKLLTSIIMKKEISVQQKKENLKQLLNCIEQNQDQRIYHLFKQITIFGFEQHYFVSSLDLQRFENFDNGFQIVQINYQQQYKTQIDDYIKQVKQISNIIISMETTKVAKLISCGILSLLFIPPSYTLLIPFLLKILILSVSSVNVGFNILIKNSFQVNNDEFQKKIKKEYKQLQ